MIKRIITFYDKKTEKLVKTIELSGMSLEELQRIYKLDKQDQMYDCYPVDNNNVILFKQFIKDKIKFMEFSCFVESYNITN